MAQYAREHRNPGVRWQKVEHAPRTCTYCGEQYVPKSLKATAAYCSRACKDKERSASGRARAEHLWKKYGITPEEYDQLLAAQGGGCALCGVKPEELTTGKYRTYLHVDHCHDSGRVRGLLCPDHNLLLGRFGDSPEMFRRVLNYLEAAASD
ncbi:endonuclease VII domain-containing protein [Streptomyces sp. NPDC046915]|uniref:endonuclease VII domain-containing protein n=1 Tax=Streptomyces sp. NPDC046915 TaxID=3155257 RepID=UPI0034116A04